MGVNDVVEIVEGGRALTTVDIEAVLGQPVTARLPFDPQIAEQIYQLCGEHTDIPINTVGLGDYFDRDMGTFLRNLARLTGGTFRGR